MSRAIKILLALVTVIAIAIVFFVGFGLSVYWSLLSSEVKVPDVVGKDRFVAESELTGAGLNFRVRAVRPSNQLKADSILFQLPRAGEVVKAGQTVAVDVSRPAKEGEASDAVNHGDNTNANKPAENDNTNKPPADNLNENKPKRTRNANGNANSNANGNANNGNRNANSTRPKPNANANNGNADTAGNANRRTNNNRSGEANQNSNRPKPNANRATPPAPTPPRK